MKNLLFLLAIAFSCQSCVTTEPVAPTIPTAASMVGHNYGSMSDSKALQLLKAWGDSQFKDPYSVKYKITQSPRQGWGRKAFSNDTPKLGWIFKATTNAKNGFGAYTGIQEHVYLISGGKAERLSVWVNTGGVEMAFGSGGVGNVYGYR